MLERIAQACERLGLRDRQVLVAASGGVDSTVLLDALCELRGKLGIAVAVGHVDHALRGAASAGDADFVRALAEERGCAFRGASLADGELARARAAASNRERPTVQEAARARRYEELRAMVRELGAQAIATGHTLDDQAETVLLRLVRGAGPSGLGGIPERSPDGAVVRPLLGVSRREIEAWAGERGLVWREDASNESDAYARNRLRREVLPQLERNFNRRVLQTIADFAETSRTDAEWLDGLVDDEARRRFAAESDAGGAVRVRIEQDGWNRVPLALRRRLAARLLRDLGLARETTRAHLERIVAFLGRGETDPQPRELELPLGARIMHRGNAMVATGPPGPMSGLSGGGNGAC